MTNNDNMNNNENKNNTNTATNNKNVQNRVKILLYRWKEIRTTQQKSEDA